jgi:hypothetical protein
MGDAWVSLPSRPVGCLRPFGLGIPARGGPIPAVTAELSLLPTSRSPYTIALPYRRATAEAERKGLPQLTTEKLRIGEVGAYTPVGVLDVAPLFGRRGDQPTYHFGHGMSASFAVSDSRGFKWLFAHAQPSYASLILACREAGR